MFSRLLQHIDETLKVTLDRSLALGLLTVTAPALATVALLIRLDSKGPALFVAERVGKDGSTFRCLKFRTMHLHSEELVSPDLKTVVQDNDPRVTRLGKYLRAGFDEIPQLLNVVKGDMALVGPRPDAPWMLPKYSQALHRRLDVRPGVTGLSAVLNSRELTTEEGYAIDLWYIENRNLLLDAVVLAATPIYVFGLRRHAPALVARILKTSSPQGLVKDGG